LLKKNLILDLQGGERRVENDEFFINGCRLRHSLEAEIAAAKRVAERGQGWNKNTLERCQERSAASHSRAYRIP